MKNKGIIKQIIGPVVDVYFENNLPDINTALIIEADTDAKRGRVVLEVSQHLGLSRARCISRSEEHTSELQSH